MDSTTVAIIARAATELGMTGAAAFGWYLAAKLGLHVLWASFAVFVVVRATNLLARIGSGQRLVRALEAALNNKYLNSNQIDAGCEAIRKHVVRP